MSPSKQNPFTYQSQNPQEFKEANGEAWWDPGTGQDPIAMDIDDEGDDVDPDDAMRRGFTDDYDAEEDTFGTKTLFGFAKRDVMQEAPADGETGESQDAGNQSFVQEGIGKALDGAKVNIEQMGEGLGKTVAGGAHATIDFINENVDTSELDLLKDVGAGLLEGTVIQPVNLIDWAASQAALGLHSKLTGKSKDQLLQEKPEVYTHKDIELPEWFQPETQLGGFVNDVSQWVGGYTGLGILTKLGKAKAMAVGAGKIPEEVAAWGQGVAQKYPTLLKASEGALKAIEASGKAIATDMVSFAGHQGNAANLITELAGQNLLIASDLSRWLVDHTPIEEFAVNASDNEGEARLKNGMVSFYGETLGPAAFAAAKLAKSVGKFNQFQEELLEAGTKTLKAGTEAYENFKRYLTEVKDNTVNFEKAMAEVEKQDPQQLLDMLTNKQMMDNASQEGAAVGAKSQTGEGGAQKSTTPLHIVHPTDDMAETVSNVYDIYRGTKHNRLGSNEAAIRNVVDRIKDQSKKAFNTDAYGKSLNEKLKKGEKVSLDEEIMENVEGIDLTNIDDYKEKFKTIREATVKHIQRYESNENWLNRVVGVLGFDIGDDLWRAGIDNGHKAGDHVYNAFDNLLNRGVKGLSHFEENLLNTGGFKLLYKELLPRQISRLGVALDEALATGNMALATEIRPIMKEHLAALAQAKFMYEQHLSYAGRILQTAQADTSLEAGIDFMEAVRKGQQGLPLLAHGADDISDNVIDTIAMVSRDLHAAGAGSSSSPAGQRLIAKTTLAALNALQTVAKAGKYSVGFFQEQFYNNVLDPVATSVAIIGNTGLMKGFDTAATGVGAAMHLDGNAVMKAVDDTAAFAWYMTEGVSAGLKVFFGGGPNELNYVPRHPRVVSMENVRATFGKSIGDHIQATIGGNNIGKFADKVVDSLSTVILTPSTHVIGSLDTAFRVANQRSLIFSELTALGRMLDKSGTEPYKFATQHVNSVTSDLITMRNNGFKDESLLTQNLLNLQQLKNLNEKLIGNTDQMTLSAPLKGAKSAYYDPAAQFFQTNSDRWVYKQFADAQRILDRVPLIGTWVAPFTKVFANGVQYGADSLPGISLMSPYNRQVASGQMGREAQYNFLGRQMIGAVLGLTGAGLAVNGYLAPTSGSKGAKSLDTQLTGQNAYTIRIPVGEGKAITYNLSKASPIADLLLLPARLYQVAWDASQHDVDTSASFVAAMTTLGEAFSTGRYLRGATLSLDTFMNPTYSSGDNFVKTLEQSLLYNILPLGGTKWKQLTRMTDPYYRDAGYSGNPAVDVWNYWRSVMPWTSKEYSPAYDMFGDPRPRDDYLDTTKISAQNIVRLFTPVGMKYVSNDPFVAEVEKFGKYGQTLTPPTKNVSIGGFTVPLDRFKNEKGESLWDAYNRELRDYRADWDGKEMSLREYLNSFIKSDLYQKDLQDNKVSYLTGKRNAVIGSRWAEISANYLDAKDTVKGYFDPITAKGESNEEYVTQYRNEQGLTLEQALEKLQELKENQEY